MKTAKQPLAIFILAALLCALPISGALAWKIKTGETKQGALFQGSGVSFRLPPLYTLYGISQGDGADAILLRGPENVVKTSPEITVTLWREPFDLDQEGVDADLDYVTAALSRKSAVCVADERFVVNGADMQRRIFLFDGKKARPEILIRYRFNAGGIGVTADYLAQIGTVSVPDDLSALPLLVESLKVE